MQKISASTTTANAAGEFTEGNPGAGVEATLLKAAWLNTLQRELVALIEAAGLALSTADDAQLLKAIKVFVAGGFTKDEANQRFVRMGSGPGQLANLVSIGWNGSKLKASVDGNDLGVFWSESNFDPSQKADLAALADKMPTAGGSYRPIFMAVGCNALAVPFTQGAYLGWNGGEAGFSGEMNYICNSGQGTGGHVWRSVNSNNTQTGPSMTYSYGGTLTVPVAISTPAITSNTTVPTQAATDNSQRIANTAFVKAQIAAMVNGSPEALDTLKELAAALGNDPNFASSVMSLIGDRPLRDSISTVGFANNDVDYPYMRRTSDGQAYLLQPRLGFTPIEQGGGASMGGNKIRLGWNASGLMLQVDQTPQGVMWGQNNFNRPDSGNFFPVAISGDSVTLPAGGTWCFSLMHYYSDGRGVNGKSGQAAGGTTISFSGGSTIYGFAWRYMP